MRGVPAQDKVNLGCSSTRRSKYGVYHPKIKKMWSVPAQHKKKEIWGAPEQEKVDVGCFIENRSTLFLSATNSLYDLSKNPGDYCKN